MVSDYIYTQISVDLQPQTRKSLHQEQNEETTVNDHYPSGDYPKPLIVKDVNAIRQ